MSLLKGWLTNRKPASPRKRSLTKARRLEQLESRAVFAADTLPVLLVIADQQDFYFREYHETRQAIEAKGLSAVVAATTTNPSTAHPGTGQQAGQGTVNPTLHFKTSMPMITQQLCLSVAGVPRCISMHTTIPISTGSMTTTTRMDPTTETIGCMTA